MTALNDATILIIDDEIQNLMVMDAYLSPICKEVVLQTDIELGLALARQKQPDIVLLDILMRAASGYEVCQRLKADACTRDIPVIFLTSLARTEDKVKGFAVGGVDYISKPFDLEEMLVRIESCMRVHQKIREAPQKAIVEYRAKAAAAMQRYDLNECEVRVLRLYGKGLTYAEIAERIRRSKHTVSWYIKRLFQKLEVDSRAALIQKAHEAGLFFPSGEDPPP